MPLSLIALQYVSASAETGVPGPVQLIVSCDTYLPDLLVMLLPLTVLVLTHSMHTAKHAAIGVRNAG